MARRTALPTPGWASKDEPRVEPQIEAPESPPPVVDGRSLRATGRTEQFATRIRPETKALIQQLAREEGITMAEVLERAVGDYKAARDNR
jgi:hypothetical protein